MLCANCGGAIVQAAKGRRRRYCSRSCQARAYRARRAELPAAPRRRPATELTTVGIVRGAVELADRAGMDGLSVRRLATEMGIATTGLYRHFSDRTALLTAMVDLVLAEIPTPPAELTHWRDRIRYEARQEWQLYHRHPWMLPTLARTRPPVGPALLDILERTFAALNQPGVPREAVLSIYLSVSGLVQGLAMLPLSEERRTERTVLEPSEETWRAITELVTPDSYPILNELADFTGQRNGPGISTTSPRAATAAPGPESAWPALEFDDLFESALALLLDGIAARFGLPEPADARADSAPEPKCGKGAVEKMTSTGTSK
ncbi:TetR/AcrR family transcriptional regulator [Nocardia pseudovaccinii]|uniref:TetR/AcrR family transcriptional regulator n=1 Tax=Nocardia pseudovaccinii TaxID=189540 RepID=UPI003D8C5D5D